MRYLLLVSLLPAVLLAQNTSGSLSGTVQDAHGAVIPDVKVTLTGEGNGFVRTVTTTHEGFFSFPDLTPATFTLTVEAPGFKLYRETRIAIESGEQRSLGDLKLQIGRVSDSVTITADSIAVNLSSGERSGVLTGEQLDKIALRGRDIFDAVSLIPGVVDTSDGRDAPGPTSIGNIYILGGRNDSKNMTVDGVTNLDTGSNGTVHSMPSMDSVAEVKVLMSAYSAENGRNPTSINVITKGGGQLLHGGAAWYFRNEDLNANDYFNNEAGRPRTKYRYNIASYYVSGPLLLPKLGHYDTYAEARARPVGNFIFTNTEFYVQDNWKALRNLTLDFGVRFYHDPPQYDSNGQLASFLASAYNRAAAPVLLRPATVNGVKVALDPLTGTTYPSGLIGDFVPGVGDPANGDVIGGKDGTPRGLYTTAPISVAPRLGFAWDPFSKGRTAIRGGGGIYFDRVQGNPVMGQIGNPPTVFSPTQYYGSFSDIAASAGAGLLSPSGSITSLAGKGHQQAVYNFNLSIQHQLTSSSIVEIGYTGSLGRHLLWQRNINPVPLGASFLNLNPQNRDPTTNNNALPANFLRPYQGLGDLMLYEFASSSNYHAFLTGFQQRMSHGFQISLSYTFSKALDTADSNGNAIDPFLDPRARNYGPAGFDRRQVFSANFYWTLPSPGKGLSFAPLHWIADHWEIAGVARFNTGGPFTPGYSLINGIASPTGSASEGARVQVLDPNAPLAQRFGPPPEPFGQSNVPWTVSSTAPQLGNLGRNTITGPGTENWDLSLYRKIQVTERVVSFLRLETYNTFNHTQFSGVNQTLQFDPTGAQVNPLFDQPTSARPPRRIQIALRIQF